MDRYHRQILLPGFGEAGQSRLADARALIIGCGALGTVAASTLARAGVGQLVLVDRDFVEITNLQRQLLYDEADLEPPLPKAEAARQKIARINRHVEVTSVVDDADATNLLGFARGCDVIVDGLDNFETRFLVNDAAVQLGIPYVYAGAVGTVGMCFVILPRTAGGDSAWEQAGRSTACLRCLFDQPPPSGTSPTCDTVGVLAPAATVAASYQAAEVLKILTGNWEAINLNLLHFDLWQNSFRSLRVGSVGECPCCQQRDFVYLQRPVAGAATRLCGSDAIQLKQGGGDGRPLNLATIAQRLRVHGPVKTNHFLLRAEITEGGCPYQLTVFADGRAIIKGTQQPSTARSIYARYIGT